MLYIIIFVLGTAIGSFLNCLIHRLNTGEKILTGRSHCPFCQKAILWYDLIPVLSFFLLRGRCRHCQKKISWQYPLIELATGLLAVFIFCRFIFPSYFSVFNLQFSIFNFLIACFLIVVFVYDLKHYIIPDEIIYPAIILTVIYNLFYSLFGIYDFQIFSEHLLAGFFPAIFFLLIYLISKGKWLGFGDVKLVFLMGNFLSFPNILVALFLAFFLGAIIGIGLVFLKKKNLKSEVPFGPFLVTGTLIAMFLGREIIEWYLNLSLFSF